MQDTSTTADAYAGQAHDSSSARGCWGAGVRKRRWSALEIAIVIGSFLVFWPLGVLAIILKVTKGELWAGASEAVPPWQNFKGPSGFEFGKPWKAHWKDVQSSGNAAFDEYRKQQLEKLEAERRKLDEERKAFAEHLDKLRRAKDQEEFDRFMAERNASAAPHPSA